MEVGAKAICKASLHIIPKYFKYSWRAIDETFMLNLIFILPLSSVCNIGVVGSLRMKKS